MARRIPLQTRLQVGRLLHYPAIIGKEGLSRNEYITYLDNNSMNKPNTGNAAVFALETVGYVSKEQLIAHHPRVFEEGVGILKGEYHIRLSANAVPTQHSPRRVPVALQDNLKNALDDLVKQHIITPVTEPTPWINSVMVVPKKNETLRICIDPKDLIVTYNVKIINYQQ